MNSTPLKSVLEKLENDLYEQLKVVQLFKSLLDNNEALEHTLKNVRLVGQDNIVSTELAKNMSGMIKKGNKTWPDYSKELLQTIGGVGSAGDVVEYAKKANPDLNGETIKNAISKHLSILYRNGELDIQPIGDNKNKGYIYSIKK